MRQISGHILVSTWLKKRAQKDIQIKMSCKKGTEATNAETGKADTLLGDPVVNTTTGIENKKGKGQKDKIGIDDIGIFESIFKGLPARTRRHR